MSENYIPPTVTITLQEWVALATDDILRAEIERRGLCVWTTDARDKAEEIFKLMQGRDPAKLDGLLEAVRRVSANATDMGDMCAVPSETIDGLDAALAALEGGEK